MERINLLKGEGKLATFYPAAAGRDRAIVGIPGHGGSPAQPLWSEIRRAAIEKGEPFLQLAFGPKVPYPEQLEFARRAIALLEGRGISKVDLVAHSMGGWVAAKIDAENPRRGRRMVGISVPATPLELSLAKARQKEWERARGAGTPERVRTLDEVSPKQHDDWAWPKDENQVRIFHPHDIIVSPELARTYSSHGDIVLAGLAEIPAPKGLAHAAMHPSHNWHERGQAKILAAQVMKLLGLT